MNRRKFFGILGIVPLGLLVKPKKEPRLLRGGSRIGKSVGTHYWRVWDDGSMTLYEHRNGVWLEKETIHRGGIVDFDEWDKIFDSRSFGEIEIETHV